MSGPVSWPRLNAFERRTPDASHRRMRLFVCLGAPRNCTPAVSTIHKARQRRQRLQARCKTSIAPIRACARPTRSASASCRRARDLRDECHRRVKAPRGDTVREDKGSALAGRSARRVRDSVDTRDTTRIPLVRHPTVGAHPGDPAVRTSRDHPRGPHRWIAGAARTARAHTRRKELDSGCRTRQLRQNQAGSFHGDHRCRLELDGRVLFRLVTRCRDQLGAPGGKCDAREHDVRSIELTISTAARPFRGTVTQAIASEGGRRSGQSRYRGGVGAITADSRRLKGSDGGFPDRWRRGGGGGPRQGVELRRARPSRSWIHPRA